MVKLEWSHDEAWAAHQEALNLRGDLNDADPTLPYFQWNALKTIEARRHIVEAGDGYEVLACIRKCVTHGVVAPEWLAYAFNRRYDAVLNCKAKSWDDPLSFGKPYKKGANLNAMRKRRLLRFAVWNEARRLLNESPQMPIDEYFFEVIGKPFNIGKTLASEYYYEAKQFFTNSKT